MSIQRVIEQARQLGIDTTIETFKGEGYHYYDTTNNTIMIDTTSDNITIEDIIHEYIHHIQYEMGYKGLMMRELNEDYNMRSHEYHAEIVCTKYNEFLTNDKLNIKEILSYYEDIIACFYEEG